MHSGLFSMFSWTLQELLGLYVANYNLRRRRPRRGIFETNVRRLNSWQTGHTTIYRKFNL